MGFLDLFDGLRATLRLPPRRTAAAAVPAHQLPTVTAVLAELQKLAATDDQSDGVWQFNRMYLQVTELVAARLREGYFSNDTFMNRLDIVFAQLYLDARAADTAAEPIAACWDPIFTSRAAPLAPIQFALAGMNAHINHDLPVAVVSTCEQLGLHPGSRGVRSDYAKVTLLLAEVHEQVRQSFLDGVVLATDRELSPLLTLVGSWSIGRAREAAWVNSEVLWQLRRSPALAAQFRESLSRTVGLATRTLLVPVEVPV